MSPINQTIANVSSKEYGLTTGNKSIVKDGLITYLDAGNPSSYPGTGTVWYDLSTSGYNYNIVASAYNSSGPKYMDFNGSYGIAKSQNSSNPAAPYVYTIMLWTRIKDRGDWRTLYRPYDNNHTVIIEYNTYNMGMYSNINGGFFGSGYNQTSLPSWGNSNWICLFFKVNNSTNPYWQMSYNDTPDTIRASLSDSRTYTPTMLGNLGGWGNGNTTPSDASQYWGDIGLFLYYNKFLSTSEMQQNFVATRSRFGI